MSFNHQGKMDLRGGTLKTCPICKSKYNGYPATSRKDNKTEICPSCGQKEALDDYMGYLKIEH